MSHGRRFHTTKGPIGLVTLWSFLSVLFPPAVASAQEATTEAAPEPETPAAQEAVAGEERREPGAAALEDKGGGPRLDDTLVTDSAEKALHEPAAEEALHAFAAAATASGGSEVSGGALSLPGGAAKVGGMGEAFNVALSTGSATFSVPIPLLSARGLAQPQLTLSYSSAGGSGAAGIGWDLGAPAIARDTSQGPPSYDDVDGPGGDTFRYNGADLVPLCVVSSGLGCTNALSGEVMPAWSAGWRYFRPRIEGSFQRFFLSPDKRTWRVQDKSGLQAEFGAPLDSSGDTSALETAPGDATRIYRWNVTRQYDESGSGNPLGDANPQPSNLVVYRYTSQGNIAVPADIYDTPPAGGSPATAPLSSYAHHTRLVWQTRPDTLTNYRRGWLTTRTQRLAGIDVTSMPFTGGTTRLLVRRIHFTYDTQHVSLLTSIQQEGRCGASETSGVAAEQSDGTLPATTCAALPPITLGYTDVRNAAGVAPTSTIAGFQGFDTTVHTISNSPSVTVGDGYTSFLDANADGLADVLSTSTTNPLSPGNHLLFLNGAGGSKDHFGSFLPMTLAPAATGLNIGNLNFTNGNLLPFDFDGNGLVDLTDLAVGTAPQVFTAHVTSTSASWLRSPPVVPSSLYPTFDISNHNPRVSVLDVNGDGAVDVVYTGDTGIQTYLSLSPWLGGNGAFGTASATASGVTLSAAPIQSCVPTTGTPITFNDPNVRVADMNGDGFPDLVRLSQTELLYWPGRGDGRWGAGDLTACKYGQAVSGLQVSMSNSLLLSSLTGLQLSDVNGDGLADLVQLSQNGAKIWLNLNGNGLSAAVTVQSALEPTIAQIRLLDIDGNGTSDIVWADSGKYRYMDLLGVKRPWLLTRIANGYGKTTDIAYGTSTDEMLAAASAGNPWSSALPVVLYVVKSVTVGDNLAAAGRASGNYVTTYTYRDPAYDARRHDFRGFADEVTTIVGDTNSPTLVTETHFLTGECVDEDSSGRCGVNARALENLRDPLRGLARVVDVRDATGLALSTTHTTYDLRRLYVGTNGVEVRQAFPSTIDTYQYDTAAFAPSAQLVTLPDVQVERSLGTPTSDPSVPFTLAASAGRVRTARGVQIDAFGNGLTGSDYGCLEGCAAVDETITRTTVSDRPAGDASGWLWRTTESYVSGSFSPGARAEHIFVTYDALGRPVTTAGELVGSLPLVRDSDVLGAEVAPAPPTASRDGLITLSRTTYDAYGNPIGASAAGGSCVSTMYDATYAQLAILSGSYVGAPGEDGCGTTLLSTTVTYDRGIAAIVERSGPNGEVGRASYDSLGRITALYAPHPQKIGSVSGAPSATYQYLVTSNPVSQPWSIVVTSKQAGVSADDPAVHTEWSYVDGLGRALASVDVADPTAGDGAQYLVSHFVDFDAKGAVLHAYRAFFWNGTPTLLPLASAPTAFARQTNDAFARPVDSFTIDGAWSKHVAYHALSTDVWDARHLTSSTPGPIYTTVVADGHGRKVTSIERFATPALDSRITTVAYRPTGEPTVITRAHGTGSDAPVVRWLRFDSLGRLVLNVEPDTSVGFSPDPNTDPDALRAIRYAYDDAGHLVGTSDARGCGQNLFYDAAGRQIATDYSPCTADQAAYTPPDLSTGDGTETFFVYDAADVESDAVQAAGCTSANVYRGKLVSISSRGSKSVASFDGRGRATCSARRIAKPGAPASALASRYAQRWYAQVTSYDGADRVVQRTTGARSPELLVGGASAVTQTYALSGAVSSVGSSYGPLVTSFTHDADLGPVTLTYGDVAGTTTVYGYDARHRPVSVTTSRSAPSLWSSPPSGYTPPTAPATTQQLVLESVVFGYDPGDSPNSIQDLRNPAEWPAGAKPVSRTIGYDDLSRVIDVKYTYPGGGDAWTSPFEAEDESLAAVAGGARPMPHVSFDARTAEETFAFDWKGNTISSDDDAHAFYDRSLGKIVNGDAPGAGAGPYQLLGAGNRGVAGATTRAGDLEARYDASGELVALSVHRDGPCLPAGASCWQRFAYTWDEVGHLADARRWDLSDLEKVTAAALDGAAPSRKPDITLSYAYSASDDRTLKTATDAAGNQAHTAYVFDTLSLRRTTYEPIDGDYVIGPDVETAYLSAIDRTLARVVYASSDAPSATSGRLHVFLELPDHAGSTSIVLDRDSSELVERGTYSAFGSDESDYRPQRWQGFREERRFTGKEDDIEVGLHYFGKRYYSAQLGRWMSPDPLALNVPGKADANLYAYVGGRTYSDVDKQGLEAITLLAVCIAALVAAGTAAATNAAMQILSGKKWNWQSFGFAALSGAVAGAATMGMGAAVGAEVGTTSAISATTVAQHVVMAAAGGFAGNATSALLNGASLGDALKSGGVGALIGMGVAGVAYGTMGMNAWSNSVGGGHVAAGAAAGTGSVGEALVTTTAGAALSYGFLKMEGASDGLAIAGAAMGGINGAYAGARGSYDWSNPTGYVAFALDSTWGLAGTTTGNLLNTWDTFFDPSASYQPGMSYRMNRQVFTGGLGSRDYAFTEGNVTSNVSSGVSGDLLDDHESLHIWQQRIFGPMFQLTYVGNAVVNGTVSVPYALLSGHNVGSALEAGAYFDSPFEWQAYNNQGYYPAGSGGRNGSGYMWW